GRAARVAAADLRWRHGRDRVRGRAFPRAHHPDRRPELPPPPAPLTGPPPPPRGRRGEPRARRGEPKGRRGEPEGPARRTMVGRCDRPRGETTTRTPPSWRRTQSRSKGASMGTFDAIVVGAGQAGPSLAARLTGAGMTVALVERHLVGGTCVNTGCMPTKALV